MWVPSEVQYQRLSKSESELLDLQWELWKAAEAVRLIAKGGDLKTMKGELLKLSTALQSLVMKSKQSTEGNVADSIVTDLVK
jgi:hypothetical protein